MGTGEDTARRLHDALCRTYVPKQDRNRRGGQSGRRLPEGAQAMEVHHESVVGRLFNTYESLTMSRSPSRPTPIGLDW
jgi:hypothetical protein